MIISCDAVIGWATRYAEQAERLATDERDPRQRREYLALAEVCRRVPARRPRTFREALQAVWFLMRGIEMEQGDVVALGISVGRWTSTSIPTTAPISAPARTTRQEARELLEELYLKFHRPYSDAHIMVGGLKEDGPGAGVEDGTNDLSYEILDIAQTHRLLIDLGARVHKGTPRAFLRKCAAVSACNIGFSVFGDEAALASFERVGVAREDALRYTIVGCVETIIPGVERPAHHGVLAQPGQVPRAGAQRRSLPPLWRAARPAHRRPARLHRLRPGDGCLPPAGDDTPSGWPPAR